MKSKWLSELKKIGFLRLGLLAVAAIILIRRKAWAAV